MVEQIIMRSGSNTLNGFNFDHIVPASGADFKEQVRSCIEQLQEFLLNPHGRYTTPQDNSFAHPVAYVPGPILSLIA